MSRGDTGAQHLEFLGARLNVQVCWIGLDAVEHIDAQISGFDASRMGCRTPLAARFLSVTTSTAFFPNDFIWLLSSWLAPRLKMILGRGLTTKLSSESISGSLGLFDTVSYDMMYHILI